LRQALRRLDGRTDHTKASKPLLKPIPLHGIAPEHMGQCPARHMKTPQKQCLLNLFRAPCHVRRHARRGNGIHHRAGYQPHPLTAYPLFARTRRLAAQQVPFLPTRGKQFRMLPRQLIELHSAIGVIAQEAFLGVPSFASANRMVRYPLSREPGTVVMLSPRSEMSSSLL
jgi:hypothetical protein